MSKFHVQFDPAVDSQTLIVAAIAAIFAASTPAGPIRMESSAASATLHPLDNPAVGAPVPPADDGQAASATNGDGSIRFDKDGLPWDARIHSTPPTMTKKDVWRAKRGIEDAVFASVAAELRARFPQAPAVQQLPVTVAAPGVHPGTLPTTAAALASLPAPAASLPGLPGLAAPTPPVNTPYQDFVLLISSNMAPAGKLTEDYVKAGLQGYGVPGGDIKAMSTMDEATVKAIHAAFAQVIAG